MLVGYNLLRRSSHSPTVEEANLIAVNTLVQAGCQVIYLDFLDGDRRQLKQILSLLEPGYTLLVPRFEILAKSQSSFLQIIETLKKHNSHVQSLEENYLLDSNSPLIECFNLATKFFLAEDRSTSNSKLIPFKREDKGEGRPPTSEEKKELIRLLRSLKINNKKITICQICKMANIGRTTYYNLFPIDKKIKKIAS